MGKKKKMRDDGRGIADIVFSDESLTDYVERILGDKKGGEKPSKPLGQNLEEKIHEMAQTLYDEKKSEEKPKKVVEIDAEDILNTPVVENEVKVEEKRQEKTVTEENPEPRSTEKSAEKKAQKGDKKRYDIWANVIESDRFEKMRFFSVTTPYTKFTCPIIPGNEKYDNISKGDFSDIISALYRGVIISGIPDYIFADPESFYMYLGHAHLQDRWSWANGEIIRYDASDEYGEPMLVVFKSDKENFAELAERIRYLIKAKKLNIPSILLMISTIINESEKGVFVSDSMMINTERLYTEKDLYRINEVFQNANDDSERRDISEYPTYDEIIDGTLTNIIELISKYESEDDVDEDYEEEEEEPEKEEGGPVTLTEEDLSNLVSSMTSLKGGSRNDGDRFRREEGRDSGNERGDEDSGTAENQSVDSVRLDDNGREGGIFNPYTTADGEDNTAGSSNDDLRTVAENPEGDTGNEGGDSLRGSGEDKGVNKIQEEEKEEKKEEQKVQQTPVKAPQPQNQKGKEEEEDSMVINVVRV